MKFVRSLLYFLCLSIQVFGSSWFQNDPGPTYEEEVYLSLRYQGILDEVLVAYYDGKNFYLPLTELFDLLAVNYVADPSTFSVSGTYLSSENQYVIDFQRFFASMGDRVWSLDADEFLLKEIDYFVSPSLLNMIFDLTIEVNLSSLSINLGTPEELPIVQRYKEREKERLRTVYNREIDEADYEIISSRIPKRVDGAFIDYSVYNSLSRANNYFTLNLGAGGELFAGDVEGSIISSVYQGRSFLSASNLRWRFVDTSQPWYTSITVGEQNSTGLINQSYRGVHITNEPLNPERSYDTYVIDGLTDPDAEVELYENDKLVDVMSADDIGYYRFMVPLNYGQSKFKIRIFERQGRVIELDRQIQIPFNFLPVNEVRYFAGTGRLDYEGSPWHDQPHTMLGQVSVGLKNWLTGRAGVEYIQNNNNDKPVYYTQLSSRIGGDVLLNFDAVQSNYYSISLRNTSPRGASINGSYSYYRSEGLYNSRGYRHRLNSTFFSPFKYKNLSFTGRGALNYAYRQGNHELGFTANVSQFIKGFRIQTGLNEYHVFAPEQHSARSTYNFSAVYTIPRRPDINPWLRGTYFRSELTYSRVAATLKRYTMQVNKQLSQRLKTQGVFAFDFATKNSFIEIGVIWDLDMFRSATSMRSAGSNPSIIQTLRGSMGWDRINDQFVWDNRQQVGRSGLTVKMFVDENNSGAYDNGEEVIPGNALTVIQSSSRAITKNGVTRLTQLQPYTRYNFRINEARIDNPVLAPSKKKFAVITDPNRYKMIEVPFYTIGIIEGSVDRKVDGKYFPVAGLRLQIRSLDGAFEQTVRTFSDGSFYSMEVPPGRYELEIDEAQLEFLRARSLPASRIFTVQQSSEGDFVEGLNFVLE